MSSISETCAAQYLLSALKFQGHEVLVCSDIPGADVDIIDQGYVDVRNLLDRFEFDADVVLFVEGGSMALLPDLRRAPSILSAWYAIDTHMDCEKHLRLARLFDVTFVAQKKYLELLAGSGLTAVEWLPLAYPKVLEMEGERDRDINIAYVGSSSKTMHPERFRLLEKLKAEFSGTHFSSAEPKEMIDIYRRSKIVFNFSIHNDVNMRWFEATGAGAVLLTDPCNENVSDDLFKEGEHYVAYSSSEDLIEKATALLVDAEKTAQIGTLAREHVLSKHTYETRAFQITSVLQGATSSGVDRSDFAIHACLAAGLLTDALLVCAEQIKKSDDGKGRLTRAVSCFLSHWLIAAVTLSRLIYFVRQVIR